MAYQEVFKRVEIKYILTTAQRASVEKAMEGHMVRDRYGRSDVRNIYCDTDTWILARRSIDRPLYKEKIRIRSYGDSGDDGEVFLELKKKYDGIVYKRRTALPYREAINWVSGRGRPDIKGQIADELDYTINRYESLRPMMCLSYDRDAFASTEGDGFRLTLDTNIRARLDDFTLSGEQNGTLLLPEDYTLMELKIKGAIPLWLSSVMTEEGIYKESFSKYGNAYKLLIMNHPFVPRQKVEARFGRLAPSWDSPS